MKPLVVYPPDALTSGNPPDLSFAAYRFLAQGDSWFSLGTLNPAKNSNLLFEMEFRQFACAVNCARPGATLARMVDLGHDPVFGGLLQGRRAFIWEAMLLSCGGNDLIDALQSPPDAPLPQRLLRRAAEWGPPADGPARYVSADGWQTFSRYLQANLAHMLALRDDGPSAGCPVFLHGYACPTPRDAGAGFGAGPWLLPAMQAYAIPEADWTALAAHLIHALGDLLTASAADAARFPNLHFFDTRGIAVVPAAPGAPGTSGDWVNEIHLTKAGYEKLALPWAAAIERLLTGV